jgi:hypothetical protein
MSYYVGRAYNRLTGESMDKPNRPSVYEFSHLSEWLPAHYAYLSELKKWEAFIAELPAYAVWERPKFKHATKKGIPVPRTGARRWHSRKDSGKTGVIGSSRVLPHRYMDEGDKGATHNRHIKRVERAQWQAEAMEELNQEDAYSVDEWFGSVYGLDYDYDESPYGDDYCETCNGPCEL